MHRDIRPKNPKQKNGSLGKGKPIPNGDGVWRDGPLPKLLNKNNAFLAKYSRSYKMHLDNFKG